MNPSDSDRKSGFWYCVWKYNIPATITEGAKKAASLLSQGHAAIGLPGISAGYRTPKDEFGKKIGKSYLHEELAVFATPSREIKFCFDYETKPETKLNIERDISVTGRLLQKAGAKVKVISLPGPDKGVDDLLVAQGPLIFELLNHQAKHLKDWQQQNHLQRAATISPPRKPIVSVPKKNQPQVKTNDFNRQQPNTDTVANREDRGVVNQSRETEPGFERENAALRKEPSQDNEELLAAISGYLELQEILLLGDDIARINLFFVGSRGTNQRTEGISGDTDRKNSAILEQTTSYGSTERIVNAITNFVEQSSIEVALAETLQPLMEEISHYHRDLTNGKITAVVDKLSERLKQKTAGAVEHKEQITTNVESLLKQMLQHLDKQQLLDLFIEVGKYAQGEKVKGDQVNELFSRVGQADLSLTFEQKMNMVRQLIREDKARIMILLEIQQSNESKQSRFKR